MLEDGEHELALVGEVQIDGRRADADGAGDRAHGDGLVAAIGDQRDRRIEDLLAQALALATPGRGADPCRAANGHRA
jgi:hypothetical protein